MNKVKTYLFYYANQTDTMPGEERRHRYRQSKKEDDDVSGIFESPENTELLDLVEKKNWETLLYVVLKEPHTAFVKFTGRSTNSPSAGNLLLHEACKQSPPMDVVEALIAANDKAVTTKGNSGYLPLHYACAHSAPIELIRLLLFLNPDAVKVVDEAEGVLPLHLACMTGVTKEDVYMCLLTSYPEGSMIRDDFSRLPIDYAKSIRSDSLRKVAIESLKRATWLESAAKQSKGRTETIYHKRIKGYEQSQAQQLKMIEEVHTKQIAKLEADLQSQKKELSERSQDLEDMDKHLQEMTDDFRERVESSEKLSKAKNRKLQGQIDKAKEEATNAKVALHIKVEEASDLSHKFEEAQKLNDSLSRQLEQRTEELDLALEDIESLNKRSEWLESVKESIRDLSNSEPPLLGDRPRKELSKKDKPRSSKKLGSPRKSRVRSSSVSSRRSEKMKASRKATEETRDPSFASRTIGSHRE